MYNDKTLSQFFIRPFPQLKNRSTIKDSTVLNLKCLHDENPVFFEPIEDDIGGKVNSFLFYI